MGELTKWAQDNSPFLKIPDNSSVEVCYLGYEMVDDQRNPGKQKVRYKLELNGQEKSFESASSRVAMSFDSCEIGDVVEITKKVENNQVRYFIRAVNVEKPKVTKKELKEATDDIPA